MASSSSAPEIETYRAYQERVRALLAPAGHCDSKLASRKMIEVQNYFALAVFALLVALIGVDVYGLYRISFLTSLYLARALVVVQAGIIATVSVILFVWRNLFFTVQFARPELRRQVQSAIDDLDLVILKAPVEEQLLSHAALQDTLEKVERIERRIAAAEAFLRRQVDTEKKK